MQLTLVSSGVLLAQKDGCFLLKKEGKQKKLSPKQVDSILICNRTQLTSQALLLAVEHKVDVLFLDAFGDPAARLWFGRGGRSVKLRREQLRWSGTLAGLELAKDWLQERLEGQERFLKKLCAARSGREEEFEAALLCLQQSRALMKTAEGSMEEQRAFLMGLEGNAARAYFCLLSSLLPEQWRFERRSRRPAADGFNAMLNYALGVLYGKVERACLLAGLDPYLGLVHADHPYRPSLVCDLIEPCRWWAEQVVTYLFTGRRVRQEHFQRQDSGVFLNAEGKQLLLPVLREFLQEQVRHEGRQVTRESLCLHRAHRLSNRLLDEAPCWLEEVAF